VVATQGHIKTGTQFRWPTLSVGESERLPAEIRKRAAASSFGRAPASSSPRKHCAVKGDAAEMIA
jgi:hypothetical protein